MNPGSTPVAIEVPDVAATAILDEACAARAQIESADVRIALAGLAWCLKHARSATDSSSTTALDTGVPGTPVPTNAADPVPSSTPALPATATPVPTLDRLGSATPGTERFVALAGRDAPEIAEFCIPEFASSLGMTTDSGRRYLGDILELVFRLPRLWAALLKGEVAVWRARRVADRTRGLSLDAAAFVDSQLATTHFRRIGPTVTDHLIEAALSRFDPAEAEKQAAQAREHRRVTIHTGDAGIDGLIGVDGVVDAADALDLDAALNQIAAQLSALGSTQPRDVRRAQALGYLARGTQPTLFNHTADEAGTGTTPGATFPLTPPRVTLTIHLNWADIEGVAPTPTPPTAAFTRLAAGSGIGRCENTRSPVLTSVIKDWCAGARVTVRPIIDLNQPAAVDRYEIPPGISEQVLARETACVFPYCTRPARGCDLDHITPYSAGGATAVDNLAPLCRFHHRAKTFTTWSYQHIGPGTFQWSSPLGQTYQRDCTGTHPTTAKGGRRTTGISGRSSGRGGPFLPLPDQTGQIPAPSWALPVRPTRRTDLHAAEPQPDAEPPPY